MENIIKLELKKDKLESLELYAELLKKAAGVKKGAGNPLTDKVGKVTKDQVKEIAQIKMVDLNAADTEAAMKIVEGTARSMGITVE